MESARGHGDATLRRVTSRRSLLKGLTALMAVGAIAPLAAACAPQQPAAKPAESKPADAKPAAPAATTAPAAAAQPAAAPKADAKPAAAAKPAAKPAGEPKKGGTLKWAIIGEPPAHDPVFTTATVTANFGWHVFEGLYTRDSKNGPKMDLLEKYEPSADGKKVTMTLRKGVLFHNDKELTSADVEASLKRYADIQASGKLVFTALDKMTVPDKYSVVLEFKEPRTGILPVFLSRIAAAVMPAEDVQKAGKDKVLQPIGTGPYK